MWWVQFYDPKNSFLHVVSPKYHLNELGDGDPGKYCDGSAAEVIVVFGGDWGLGAGDWDPRWPGAKDLKEANEESMPLLACAKELFELNALAHA